MKTLSPCLFVLLAGVAPLAAYDQPQVHTPRTNDHVIFLGDSTTAGGLNTAGYVRQVEQAVGEQVPELQVTVSGIGRLGAPSGQMIEKDWYVFGRLGLFPNAGQDIYLLHGPSYPETTLRMESGRELVIRGVNAAPDRPYIAGASLNGRPLDRAWLRHRELAAGGALEIRMSDRAGAVVGTGVREDRNERARSA